MNFLISETIWRCLSIIEIFLFLEPPSSLLFTVHETPPNLIQVQWEMLPGSDQQTDFFELSIRNLSSSENNIDGDTVIMTNIQGIIVRNIENHKIGFSLTNK